MAHLIACLGSNDKKNEFETVNKIIESKLFDKVYIITSDFGKQNYVLPHIDSSIKLHFVTLDFTKPTEDLVPELYVILKKHFMNDKLQELDMAVNITSGSGKEHSIVISTIMKLGYGIRLVDLDKDGNILEMM
jgi:hypothetical protein